MRISILVDQSLVGIDGVFRRVDLSGLDASLESVQFDTLTGKGVLVFVEGATIDAQERDLEAEAAEEQPLRLALEEAERDLNMSMKQKGGAKVVGPRRLLAQRARAKLEALGPRYKTIAVPRPPEQIDNVQPYLKYVERWRKAKPRDASK